MDEKPKSSIKIKHKCRIGHTTNFLQQKRGFPFFKAKNKNQIKNWEKQMQKLERIDFDMVKDNFKHFFHLNLEDNAFDKELSNLEHIFTPITFWFLINDSYFQKNTIKERLNNLLKEFSLSNYTDDNIMILQEDSENNENSLNSVYKNGYKYNTILTESQETKIKSDFFVHFRSIIKYLKNNNKENDINNNNNNNNNIMNDKEQNNKDNKNNNLENDKQLIINLIKKFHEENDKKLNNLKSIIKDKTDKINNEENNLNISNNIEKNKNNKCINYIKTSPLFEQDNKSLSICNKFIDYIYKKEKIKSKIFEENKKIFSFSEKFINLKENNNNNNNNEEINNDNNFKENIIINNTNIINIKNEIINIDDNNNDNNNNNNDNNNNDNNIDKNKIINKEINISFINNNIYNNNIVITQTNSNININNDKNKEKNINENENNNNINEYENKNIEYKVSYINNYLNKEENNILINQGICCICNNGDVEQNQFLLRCEQCSVTVHQNCYGAQIKELYNWVCDACKEMTKEEVYNLECFLCPIKGGAFKKIELPVESTFYKNVISYKHNKIKLPKNNYNIIIPQKDYDKIQFAWAHLSCALWNPNINLKNYEKKTGIFIENISYDDFNSYCVLCKNNNCGPTIKCNNDSCNCFFHPECARINNCCLEVEIINKEYQYNVYCYKHKPNLLAKKINYNCQNEIQQIICVNNELNNIYELYKKIYKNDLYQRPKIINEIEIEDFSHSRNHKKHKNHKHSNSSLIKYRKVNKSLDLENIVINLPKKKRGRKKKNIKFTSSSGGNINNNLFYSHYCKSNKKKLNNIIINNNTIINNIGSGNNINIYVSNSNFLTNCNITKNIYKKEIKRYSKEYNPNNYPTPRIEINKKEFDKVANSNMSDFEVDKYIKNKNEFIIYLIGFLNDYTLRNRVILKKNSLKDSYSIEKKSPIYFLNYDDFKKNDFPWDEIGYNNLTSIILRKSFFAIIYDEKQFKKLFLDKIAKTLKELKKNKKFEKYEIECDNKANCIGATNGKYNLLSLDSFKYKILDEKHFFPKNFLCPWCLNNTPNLINNCNTTKNKSKKENNNINNN